MSENQVSKLILPKLPFYSLKQAAAELNAHFNRTNLDESYLLHLAVSGAIKLAIVPESQPAMCYTYDDGLTRGIAHFIIEHHRGTTPFGQFWCVDTNTIRQLVFSGQAQQKIFSDIFLYDPMQMLHKAIQDERDDQNILSAFGLWTDFNSRYFEIAEEPTNGFSDLDDLYPERKQLREDLPKLLQELALEIDGFIEFELDDSFWRYGLMGNVGGCSVLPIDSAAEFNELKSIVIEMDKLFIVKPELERVINNDLRALNLLEVREKNIESQGVVKKIQDILKEKGKAIFASAVLEWCKQNDKEADKLTSKDKADCRSWFFKHEGYKKLSNDNSFKTNWREEFIKKEFGKMID